MINLTKNAVFVAKEMVKGRSGYGIRVKRVEGGCSGLYFDLVFDKKKSGDVVIKKQGGLNVFADLHTKKTLNKIAKRIQPVTVEYARTPLGPKFLTNSDRIRLNLWEHELDGWK